MQAQFATLSPQAPFIASKKARFWAGLSEVIREQD
jgi:hypothetical protein